MRKVVGLGISLAEDRCLPGLPLRPGRLPPRKDGAQAMAPFRYWSPSRHVIRWQGHKASDHPWFAAICFSVRCSQTAATDAWNPSEDY